MFCYQLALKVREKKLKKVSKNLVFHQNLKKGTKKYFLKIFNGFLFSIEIKLNILDFLKFLLLLILLTFIKKSTKKKYF